MRASIVDHYAVLGVARGVDEAELRRAFHQLALRLHPDVAGADSTAAFQQVAEAYAVLSDPVMRASYDMRLSEREREAARARNTGRPGVNVPRPPDEGTPRRAGPGDVRSGEYVGPGGRFTWTKQPGPEPARDDLIERLSLSLDALLASGAARRCEGGVIELDVTRAEAAAGGIAAIDVVVDVRCPTCFGLAERGQLWCRRCEYEGTVPDQVTVCVQVPAGTRDRTTFAFDVDPTGRAERLRVRIRVA